LDTGATWPQLGGINLQMTTAYPAFSNSLAGTITLASWQVGTSYLPTGTYKRATGIVNGVDMGTIFSFATNLNIIVTQPGILDSIGDGIADWWRARYFGGAGTATNKLSCATCDADGTGQNNLFKYLAGLDPTNSASIFRVLSINTQGADLLATWQTAGGRTNVLQASLSLGDSFSNVSPNIVLPGNGDTTTNYRHSGGANVPARFYRVKLVP
jgi:hypothetical protein